MEQCIILKFVYSEKATKVCEISTLLLSTVPTDKSKLEISQNFVAFSEYMNFKCERCNIKCFTEEEMKNHEIREHPKTDSDSIEDQDGKKEAENQTTVNNYLVHNTVLHIYINPWLSILSVFIFSNQMSKSWKNGMNL